METQDEKMYRVIMDRQRSFDAEMEARFQVDTHITEKLTARLPLPEAIANKLAFRLGVATNGLAIGMQNGPTPAGGIGE